ncbi:MAG: GntR family transcriptional regulator [Nitrospirota bacterium]|nr:GntR family transcriptional regulator [Nitrospirota bacterium]
MESSINRQKSEKLYVQLYEILKNKIETGQWAVDSQIPVEEELCRTYEVSKATVRLAILDLVRQGYLMRQQGKGTFVCKRIIPEGLTMSTSFKELMLDAGIDFTTEVLVQTIMMPTDDLDAKLDISEDQHVIYIKRLFSVDKDPILLQEAFVPRTVYPSLLEEDILNSSLIELFEKKHGVNITKVKDYLYITHITADEGRLLGLSEGSSAILLEQHFYSGDKHVIYMRSIKQPGRFRFYIEFDRKT